MSCYQVSDNHISFILSYAHELGEVFVVGGFGPYWDPREMEQLQRMAEVLRKENIRALHARYGEEPEEDEEKWIRFRLWRPPLKSLAVIKACECYLYQIAETDDYQMTVAYNVVDQIMHSAINRLPGYDQEAWEVR